MATRALILGCATTQLSRAEIAFFRDVDPWGFILFKRNVETPSQVRRLSAALRDCVGRADAPILIDQEGGRVQRLGPPHWPKYPPGRAYLARSNDRDGARELVRIGARLMAHDLVDLGISVDCLPVLDVPVHGAHDIIGDRAYGAEPETVAALGRAAAEAMIAGGVLPVIKHIPGHGRAASDSHLALPVVDSPREVLERQDFYPFAVNADMPLAMTAHVVYAAIDAEKPATLSRRVFRQVIRGSIGYQGLVMSDDLSMKALTGSFRSRAEAAIKAGCDVVLHCNGDMTEMKAAAAGTPDLRGKARRRAEAALQRIARPPEPFDAEAARQKLARAMG
jgi:beta-N-acetylhexosaminidase